MHFKFVFVHNLQADYHENLVIGRDIEVIYDLSGLHGRAIDIIGMWHVKDKEEL